VLEPGRRRRRPFFRFLPRTLDLYLARTFLSAYFICGVSFTGIYIMVEALTKLDRFLKAGDPLWLALLQYHAAMVPTIYANYLGPILSTSAAVATAVAMERGNELVPIQAAGVSVQRALAPVFVLALSFAGLNYFLQEEAIPALRAPIRRAISLTRGGPIRPDPFFDQAQNQLIKIGQYLPAVQMGRAVEISRYYPSGEIREKIDAQEVVWEPEPGSQGGPDRGRWFLSHGSIQRWNEGGELAQNPEGQDFARLKEPFQKRALEGGLLPIDLETSDQDITYLSFRELKTQLWRQPYQRHLEVKLHHHLAFPLAHLLLPALAIPLVLSSGTRSSLLAVAGSVGVSAAFYLVSSFAMNTAVNSERFSPLLAAWLPILIFGAVGATLTAHLRT
jgi:lipopolysaccharide export LptBFGC system permease protein LptF